MRRTRTDALELRDVAGGRDHVVPVRDDGLGEGASEARRATGDEPGGHCAAFPRPGVSAGAPPSQRDGAALIQALSEPPTVWFAVVASNHGQPKRTARLSRIEALEDHARAGEAARVWRQPARRRSPSRRSRDARGRQCRLLHEARTRRGRAGLRERARRRRPCVAAHCGRAKPSVRPDRHSIAYPVPRRPARSVVRSSVQRILDGLSESPAFIGTSSRDLIAANALGRAAYSPMFGDARGVPNTARFLFLDPRAREFFLEWDSAAANLVANLRRELGSDPLNRDLTRLIDDLNRESPEFLALWRSHDVRTHNTGFKAIHHPVVGDLHLTFEAMEPPRPRPALIVYGAEPGSETADRLRLLGELGGHRAWRRSRCASLTHVAVHRDERGVAHPRPFGLHGRP